MERLCSVGVEAGEFFEVAVDVVAIRAVVVVARAIFEELWNFAVDKKDTLFGGGGIVMGVRANEQCLLAGPAVRGVWVPLNEPGEFKVVCGEWPEFRDKLVTEEGVKTEAALPDPRPTCDGTGGVMVTMALVMFAMCVAVPKCTPDDLRL